MTSHHKNPGRFPNDNFLKTLYKISALFQISSENKKGAAQSLTAYGWYSSKDASQHVCIYETVKNRVHILPLISKLISVDFSWNYPKKRFRCNLFQVASKVLNKHGAASQIWTGDLILTKDALYRLSYSSINSLIIIAQSIKKSTTFSKKAEKASRRRLFRYGESCCRSLDSRSFRLRHLPL